jgi:toxin CcdB
MARFDVHRVAGQPGYLLDVQADHLAALPSRVVVPLLPPSAALPAIRDLNPLLRLDGEDVALLTQYLTAVPRADLGPAIASLAPERDAITRALDLLLTGF